MEVAPGAIQGFLAPLSILTAQPPSALSSSSRWTAPRRAEFERGVADAMTLASGDRLSTWIGKCSPDDGAGAGSAARCTSPPPPRSCSAPAFFKGGGGGGDHAQNQRQDTAN